MAKSNLMRILIAGGVAAGTLAPGIASAIDWNITGFVRQEIAVSISDDGSITNKYENFQNNNNRIIPAFGGLGGASGVLPLDNPALTSGTNSYAPNVNNGFGGLGFASGSGCGANGALCDRNGDGVNDFAQPSGSFPFNMFNTRAEVEVQAKVNEQIAAYGRFRAYFDGTSTFADDGVRVEKHFLGDTGWGDNRGNLLEVQNNDFMIDIPSLYADINFGSAWFRIGQQQIAWGEALFFRVFDVANGLDLRRHFFLDVGAEEYADERVASPGVRGSYTFSNGWEIDAFVQMFSPTIYPNTNTPYNVILDGFTVGNSKFGKGFDDAENALNFGGRVIMPDLFAKDLTVSVMAVNRRNPDGVFRWDEGGGRVLNMNSNEGVQATFEGRTGGANPFCHQNSLIGSDLDFYGNPGQSAQYMQGAMAGECGHSFELDGTGTNSYQDWWYQAALSRFDPVQSAATSTAELSGSDQLALPNGIGMLPDGKFDFVSEAFGVSGDGRVDATNAFVQNAVANNVLGAAGFGLNGVANGSGSGITDQQNADAIAAVTACSRTSSCTRLRGSARKAMGMAYVSKFFTAFGPLRGHISREFKRESIFGVGFNYIISTDPNSIFDQLIVRGEMSYTPNKIFTDISASTKFTESDEILASVILEKYQSVFDALPATYFVFEWMHRTDTDLGGRLLTGYSDGQNVFTEDEDGTPNGVSSADYLVFAFQQPFPNLIWRADFAMLADVRGGMFLQPGVRFKPSTDWQFDIYANIAADVGGQADDLLESFDHMDEVFVRASYFF